MPDNNKQNNKSRKSESTDEQARERIVLPRDPDESIDSLVNILNEDIGKVSSSENSVETSSAPQTEEDEADTADLSVSETPDELSEQESMSQTVANTEMIQALKKIIEHQNERIDLLERELVILRKYVS